MKRIVLFFILAFCCQVVLAQDKVQETDSLVTDTLVVDSLVTDTLVVDSLVTDSLVTDSVKTMTVCLENDAVKRFLDEVTYEPESESQIINYLNILDGRGDFPRPVVLPLPFHADSTFSVSKDTVFTTKVDTTIILQNDTLLKVKRANFKDSISVVADSIIVDTVFVTTLDTLVRFHHGREISIKLDTMVVVPSDTLWLTWSADSTFNEADTVTVVNGEQIDWTIYNLIPQRTYYYRLWKRIPVEAEELTLMKDSIMDQGRIHTEGRVRMIYAPSIRNIRDFGGWITTDSMRVKYGLLYRGGELNGKSNADSIDIERLKKLGIKAEIDMRYDGEVEGTGISVFGFKDATEVEIDEQPSFLFTNNSGCCDLSHLKLYYWQQRYRKEFEFIVNCLRNDMPVYYHCIWGSDRTGMLSILMGGLLGMSYSDMMKDFELSSFYSLRTKSDREFIFDYINGMGGNTLKERFYFFFRSVLGVSSTNIEYFRKVMLEDVTETETEEEEPQKPIDTNVLGVTNRQYDDTMKYDLQGRPITKDREQDIYIENGRVRTR